MTDITGTTHKDNVCVLPVLPLAGNTLSQPSYAISLLQNNDIEIKETNAIL